jgi:hypothetical protein
MPGGGWQRPCARSKEAREVLRRPVRERACKFLRRRFMQARLSDLCAHQTKPAFG